MQNIQEEVKKPKGQAYGAASLTRVLNGIGFPVTKDELINRYGTKEVMFSKGNNKTMREIVSKCTQESFKSMAELVEACARRPMKR